MTCTDIGCWSGLRVRLSELPVGDFRVDLYAFAPDEGPAYSAVCTAGTGDCTQEIFFHDLIAHRVFVRVTTAAGSVLHERYQHRYEERRLNGPRCGVTCRVAEITVPIP